MLLILLCFSLSLTIKSECTLSKCLVKYSHSWSKFSSSLSAFTIFFNSVIAYSLSIFFMILPSSLLTLVSSSPFFTMCIADEASSEFLYSISTSSFSFWSVTKSLSDLLISSSWMYRKRCCSCSYFCCCALNFLRW